MAINEQEIQEIVRSVLKGMGTTAAAPAAPKAPEKKLLGIFETADEAIAAAKAAQKEIQPMPLEFREKIIANIRKKTLENAKLLSELAVEETGMGNVGHKIIKHQLVAEKTPGTEDLKTIAWSGDRGLTLTEMGPWGVIGAVCPSTNPTCTVICNSIGMLAAGNAVVFMPHPSAKNCSNLAIDMVNRASIEVGGPENIVTAVAEPTMDVSNYIFKHKDIDMLCATGGPGVVTAVLSTGKRAMGAGAGNPPVLVDETANIPKAAQDIINGCTFDNNLPCIAEKEVVVVDTVADELIYHMEQNGCYHASPEEVQKLVDTVLDDKNGKKVISRKCVGRSAKVLLGKIGVTVGDEVRCIIFEGEKTHPLIWTELMMPILGIVRVKNVDEGIAVAVELEHGNRHSAHMHSTNINNLTRFGKAIDTAIFVKNAPSYAALGFGGEGYPTFTICSRTGEGLTSAKSFTKARRCVMGDALCIR